MNASKLLAIGGLALMATLTSYASDVDPHGFNARPFESTRSRAEVRAEAIAAAEHKAAIGYSEELGYSSSNTAFGEAPSRLTRADAMDRVKQAQRDGTLLQGRDGCTC
ncbi:MAG: hypothetical protein V4738_10560 [Pseudomonadota bacterium]